ncbi:conjugal transfer protein TraH [Pseudomonas putida]|jgi:defect-in-organelle-trafficking protein DotD|uniref:Conjugal transfer protein TraH n=2 Tax=Pseudomonas TaxID=286 RepID=A0A179RXJ2_PSEPU|nr:MULTISPECIES: DotD/TraH family lipoprotein [Pseudomonas]ARO46383.1 Conjugal transfer protein TraH [Pseudomonas putida]MDD2012217.1 DotD/TraH family lipoprotein [Pseudomonas putida]MDD2108060.1 DotD/TraH family lipoprotein [Pseudomonas asiatica]OAS12317.1 conjugal transfer protein TraH [Pseudomonas putida]RNF92677.1 conjugal transfer protein TraH [Pseudomonas putida]
MANKRYPMALVALAVALGGCASKKPDESAQHLIDQQILEASQRIEMAQADLYQQGAINSRVVMRLPSTILDDKQRVSLKWQGDAVELLAALARDRGLEFSFMGVRMPLPVDIDVNKVPYDTLMLMIRSQVGYRADVTQMPGKLELHYNRPKA